AHIDVFLAMRSLHVGGKNKNISVGCDVPASGNAFALERWHRFVVRHRPASTRSAAHGNSLAGSGLTIKRVMTVKKHSLSIRRKTKHSVVAAVVDCPLCQ